MHIAKRAPYMTSDGSGERCALGDGGDNSGPAGGDGAERRDSLLPADPETGVTAYEPFRVYLGGFIDLMARHGQPLTLLMIAPDSSETLRLLGTKGARMIGAAIARCLRQETRLYDVIGRGRSVGPHGAPVFLLARPMMTEAL